MESSSSGVRGESSSSGSRGGSFTRFLERMAPSNWCHSANERLRTPLIEVPHSIFDTASSYVPYKVKMLMGYHFMPGGNDFQFERFNVTDEVFTNLSFIRDSLGLSYIRRPLSTFTYGDSGGLRSFLTDEDGVSKILVEAITYLDGRYGRFLVLVIFGVGSTVWYGFMPSCD